MKKLFSRFLFSLLFLHFWLFNALGQTQYSNSTEFQQDKFGLFIHWGLYAQTAGEWKGHPTTGGEHFMLYERIPLKEYALIANSFNPVDFNAEQWVRTAKRAGMRYMVYTTKHHDGFAMYNSACSDYNIVKCTPFGRDPLEELAAACKKEGIKLGLYYSLGRDWEDPDVPTNWPVKAGRSNTWDYPDEDSKDLSKYFGKKVLPQIKELLTNYGDIAMIWFDTPELITKKQSIELRTLIKSLQPHCLINNRIGNGQGDYAIVEQKLVGEVKHTPWEACLTMGKNWGYNRFDITYKPTDELIRHFVDIVSKGGNLLLNVGPTGKGDFPVQSDSIFDGFHHWLSVYGEAIYGTAPWRTFGEELSAESGEKLNINFNDAEYDGTPKLRNPDLRFTCKDGKLYIIAREVKADSYLVKSILQSDKVKSVDLLGYGRIKWKQINGGLHINLKKAGIPAPIYALRVTFK